MESHLALRIRLALGAFTGLLVLQCVWLAAPVLWKSRTETAAGDTTDPSQSNSYLAGLAATFSAVRGDLWAQAAYAEVAPDWPKAVSPPLASIDRIIRAAWAAERALSYAPLSCEAWLYYASLQRLQSRDLAEAKLIKMGYYTCLGDTETALSRLGVAMDVESISDLELDVEVKSFMLGDVRKIVNSGTGARGLLHTVYDRASPRGQLVLRTLSEDVAPDFLLGAGAGGR